MTLIAFDGPTASGKSTLIKRLEADYKKQKADPLVLDERNKVRNIMEVFHENDLIRSELPPITESFLWVANQIYRVETQVSPNLGRLIFIDRYIYTPIVYQYLALRKSGVKLEDVIDSISKPFGVPLPIPDKSIILVAPIEVIEERFNNRERRKMKDSEREVTKEAIDLYKTLGHYFNNYFIVDSSSSEDRIFEEVSNILENK
ncbi:MAG: hypothetical protein US31_C0015G0018 [Berkelbacteria bacterium GW2011_GWA1_36_9]|uniref:Thymidylate kinase-like domain-containing protein n=1 Tax=Berkelbacteria bacterium GW2011_GWA1_36_9 TaxID=1618331 RepID=A0A0G0FJ63_9BACT|nr:MAG: hypothetical protein US31_C0015G0018 [Berkelbacteria bacterium GW2011_GWA1_36_9]